MKNKILIVDDDPRNIYALMAVLKTRNFHCLKASSAIEGINYLKDRGDIGIVLMDIMLPDIDGYQAISEIKKNERIKHIPIVAVTAQAMYGDKEKCLEAGADAYISKPINIDSLLKTLDKYLNPDA